MEIKTYAPVLIPTLNRSEHFKKCLESLEECSCADKTEIYVALDYPPSEKYVEGWKKNKEYLDIKRNNNHFKKLNVIYRDRNFGLYGDNSNYNALYREVAKVSDRFILTEDDNVFSKRFLEWINWGLTYFENDNSIYAICGYMHPAKLKKDIKGSYFYRHDLAAWGYGGWFKKRIPLTLELANELIKSEKVYKYEMKHMFTSYVSLLDMKKRGVEYGDAIVKAMEIDRDMYSVYPVQTFVLNKGWDGSGSHGGVRPEYLSQKMGDNLDVEFQHVSEVDETYINNTMDKFLLNNMHWYGKLLDYLVIKLYRLTGYIFNQNLIKDPIKKLVRR